MHVFKLHALDTLTEHMVEPTNWDIPELKDIANSTWACKSQIDKYYKQDPDKWEKLTQKMEPSFQIKIRMIKEFNPQHVNNAFLKLIEIIIRFNLFNNKRNVSMIDNASAPGAFITASNYWVTTMMNGKLNWKASSLISADDNTALGDSYGLARIYPERYMMVNTKFNGDTTDVKYLRFVGSKYGASADCYTSDIGMYIGEDGYNAQEAIQAKLNLGQILMGLLVLKRGGTFVTKQYTHFSSFTVSIMAIVAICFEETWIAKPITSKPDNSEEYIVARGFKEAPSVLIDIMFDRLEQPWECEISERNFTMPLLAESMLRKEFIASVINSAKVLADSQCKKINANISEYERMIASGDTQVSKKFYNDHIGSFIKEWFKLAPFKRMDKRDYFKTLK